MGLRMSEEEEIVGADFLEHDIGVDNRVEAMVTGMVEEGRRSVFGFCRRSPCSRNKNVIHVSEYSTPQPPGVHLDVPPSLQVQTLTVDVSLC